VYYFEAPLYSIIFIAILVPYDMAKIYGEVFVFYFLD